MNWLDLIWPRHCLGCDTFLYNKDVFKYLCFDCSQNLPLLKNQNCVNCHANTNGKTCTKCSGNWQLNFCLAATPYANNLPEKMVRALKYNFMYPIAQDMANIIAKHFSILQDNSFVLTFVPASKHRQSWRGFNQSELIAQNLADIFHLETRTLLRKRPGFKPQVKTRNRNERLGNLNNAYDVIPNQQSLIVKRDIVIVDDVITTGATLNDCARALKNVGARTVTGLCFARTINSS